MKEEEILSWFQNDIIPQLVSKWKFCEKNLIAKCEIENAEKNVNNFASLPVFAKIILETPQSISSKSLFIKFTNLDPFVREKLKLNVQFQNEVTFYNFVLPAFYEFLESRKVKADFLDDMICPCHFASISNEIPEKTIVVLEDLRNLGFTLSESKIDLDVNHCLIAVEKLAKFHAISLAMKYLKWSKFENLKTSFREVWFVDDDPLARQQCEDFNGLCSQRGIDFLLSQEDNEVPVEYLNNLKQKLKSVFDISKDAVTPREPFSVICHGDFCRNNILFKYKDSLPTELRFIDFQKFIYASPCVDLTFLIYMNTTQELRNMHFDNICKHYYSTLVNTVSSITDANLENITNWVSYDLFKKEFERISLHALIIVSFFLPIMIVSVKDNFDQEIREKNFREMADENYRQGGDVVSKRIAEVIVDFYKRKFFESNY